MALDFESDLIAEVPRVLRTISSVTFKWLLFSANGRQARERQCWLSCTSGSAPAGPPSAFCWKHGALGAINPGTHKKAFTAGCVAGPLLMPASVGRLRSYRCFPLACLHASNAKESDACYTYHLQYTMLQCAAPTRRKCSTSLSASRRNWTVSDYAKKQQTHSFVNRFPWYCIYKSLMSCFNGPCWEIPLACTERSEVTFWLYITQRW